MGKTVVFTGHRHIPNEEYDLINTLLTQEVIRQIENGADVFRAGGALGFDTMAALCVLALQRNYPHIRLELVLPCPTQTQGWTRSQKQLYDQILLHASSYTYLSQTYYPGLLQMRNRALVEGSDVCLAYLCNSHGGGTAFTAALALKKGLEFVNIEDLLKAHKHE